MKKLLLFAVLVLLSIATPLAASEDSESSAGMRWINDPYVTHEVIYNGNGNTGGTPPIDPGSPYNFGEYAVVLNQGTLGRTGYNFAGWNTQQDGQGMQLTPGQIFNVQQDITLYAQWVANTVIAPPGDRPQPSPIPDPPPDLPYFPPLEPLPELPPLEQLPPFESIPTLPPTDQWQPYEPLPPLPPLPILQPLPQLLPLDEDLSDTTEYTEYESSYVASAVSALVVSNFAAQTHVVIESAPMEEIRYITTPSVWQNMLAFTFQAAEGPTWSTVNLALLIAGIIIVIQLIVRLKKYKNQPTAVIWFITTVILSIGSFVLVLLTQSFRSSTAVIIDIWTIPHVVMLVVQFAAAVLIIRRSKPAYSGLQI